MSVSSSGLLRYAAAYLNTGTSALQEFMADEDLERLPPLLYLLGRAIELALKAHLFASGVGERRLKWKLGHDLAALLEASQRFGLEGLVSLTREQVLAIQLLSPYYEGKELEYFSPGYKSMP